MRLERSDLAERIAWSRSRSNRGTPQRPDHLPAGWQSTVYWHQLRFVLDIIRRLTPIPLEFWPLDNINEIYRRMKQGEVPGRAVITPDSQPS